MVLEISFLVYIGSDLLLLELYVFVGYGFNFLIELFLLFLFLLLKSFCRFCFLIFKEFDCFEIEYFNWCFEYENWNVLKLFNVFLIWLDGRILIGDFRFDFDFDVVEFLCSIVEFDDEVELKLLILIWLLYFWILVFFVLVVVVGVEMVDVVLLLFM